MKLAKLASLLLLSCLCFKPIVAQTNEPIRNLIIRYNADRDMFYAKYNLHHGHDYLHRMNALLEAWQDKVSAIKYASLNAEDRLDFTLLNRAINDEEKQFSRLEAALPVIHRYLPFDEEIARFERLRRTGTRLSPEEWAHRFISIQIQIQKALTGLHTGVFDPTLRPSLQNLVLLQTATREMIQAFKYSTAFYDGYDTLFTRRCKAYYDSIPPALKILSDSLNEWRSSSIYAIDKSGINGTPIGYQAFSEALKDQMIPYKPEELIIWAEKEMAWCTAEAKKAATEMGFGDDWKAALENVKDNYVPMGFQPTLVVNLAEEAINFIEDKKLITIPPLAKEGWYMRMLTAREQQYAPFFLGGEQILIAYPHTDMSDDEKLMCMRGNNRAFTRAVVFHELIPGHNLQHFYSKRYHTYRQSFGTPFWTEGWSVYWELTLYRNGFPRTPEERLGMLFWRMHRCARIIFSTRYHIGQWTPQQCIDYLVENVGHERANATAEVRRSFVGGYGPLYQIGYLVGAMQFMALHKEFVDSGRMSNTDFHEEILRAGSMPVALIRQMLYGMKNDPKNIAPWKFLN